MNTTPNFEKLSKLLLILFILSILGNYLFSRGLAYFFTPIELAQYNFHLHIVSIAQTVILILTHIALGVWLYKKTELNKVGWMLLALMFGINAVMLFYLNQILTLLSEKKDN